MKVTADTITDEQIRACGLPIETQEWALQFLAYRAFWRASEPGDREAARDWALASSARYRCAEAWNARHGDDK